MLLENHLLKIEDLKLIFETIGGTVYALNDVNLWLNKGETLGLVGETGCGKTVTALTILKLLPENARIITGKIIFKGKNLLEMDEEALSFIRGKEISMIFQDPATALNPTFTIGEQMIDIIHSNQGIDKKEALEKAVTILKKVGFPQPERIIKSYPHELSGGMKQRVAIAIAISSEPELIIADEPTTALDVVSQMQILKLLSEIKMEKNSSIILITHNLGIIAKICDKVAIMYAGNIVEIASVKNVFKNPLHPYTQALLEALPKTKGKKLKAISGSVPDMLKIIPGCSFHPRCEKKMSKCIEEKPIMFKVEDEHFVSCHLYKR